MSDAEVPLARKGEGGLKPAGVGGTSGQVGSPRPKGRGRIETLDASLPCVGRGVPLARKGEGGLKPAYSASVSRSAMFPSPERARAD